MTHGRRIVVALSVVAASAALSACNAKSSSMTSPDVAPPAIAGISPTPLRPSAAPQAITISGASFEPGVALLVTPPAGSAFTVSGGNIHDLLKSSFEASFVASQPGTYMLVAENDDGNASAPFPVQVGSTIAPVIASVTPDSLRAGPNPLTLVLVGSGLLPGLSVTFAGPSPIAIQGAPVVGDGSQLTISVTASAPGQYSVSVLDPNGALSNSVSLTVN